MGKGILAKRVGADYEIDPNTTECVVRVTHHEVDDCGIDGYTLVQGEARHGVTTVAAIADTAFFADFRIRRACVVKSILVWAGLTH